MQSKKQNQDFLFFVRMFTMITLWQPMQLYVTDFTSAVLCSEAFHDAFSLLSAWLRRCDRQIWSSEQDLALGTCPLVLLGSNYEPWAAGKLLVNGCHVFDILVESVRTKHLGENWATCFFNQGKILIDTHRRHGANSWSGFMALMGRR